MEEDEPMFEAEDFMCDQVIIRTEVDVDFKSFRSSIIISATKLRWAVALLANSVFPTVIGALYAYLRNQKSVVENVRRQILPTILAVLANYISRSLSSVQRGLTLRQIRQSSDIDSDTDETPEKSVHCLILSEPEGPITADVIFIHGLHGSLVKTWKQGLWRHPKHKLSQNPNLKPNTIIGDESTRSRQNSLKRSVSSELSSTPSKIAKMDINYTIGINIMEQVDEPKDDYSPCWPKDWLPQDCPGIRVIAVNYTTDPYLWRPLWIKKRNRTNIRERCKEMMEQLLAFGVGNNPIIWVGHSKGGLFIKQIIVDSWDNKGLSGIGNIYSQTKSILFYSVPHKGSILADFSLPFLRKSVELTELQRNCPFVLELHQRFLELFQDEKFDPNIFSFIETSFTLMSFIYLKIVAYDSADPSIGLSCGVPLDHREICKPAGRDCFLYKQLVNLINKVLYEDLNDLVPS